MQDKQKKALIVIDIQRDYFEGGNFVLNNTQLVLENIKSAMQRAQSLAIPVILVQHVVGKSAGPAPFFNEGTQGVEIHPQLLALNIHDGLVVKTYADSFEQTNLKSLLTEMAVDELLICGMMTQNCVTHTAISKAAEDYQVSIIGDCCASTDEMIHAIALDGISPRVAVVDMQQSL